MAPTSLKAHSKLSPSDQEIWNDAYAEEYDGLASIPTWEIITEEQFKLLNKGRKVLPTMAIATIKYDANNRPSEQNTELLFLEIWTIILGPRRLPQLQLCLNWNYVFLHL